MAQKGRYAEALPLFLSKNLGLHRGGVYEPVRDGGLCTPGSKAQDPENEREFQSFMVGDAKQLELWLVNPDHPPQCRQSGAHRRFQRERELCMIFENKWGWGGVRSEGVRGYCRREQRPERITGFAEKSHRWISRRGEVTGWEKCVCVCVWGGAIINNWSC